MQSKVKGWTNPASAVARNEDFGFTVASITTTDVTNGKSYFWNSSMPDGYYQTVDTGAITTSNGFTPLDQSFRQGGVISGFTNANPGVITVDSTADFGFATGDTILVVGVADDQTGTNSLNGTFTIASVTATTITTTTDTTVTGYSVWVSGGTVLRVTDTSGDPVRRENKAIQGVLIGTGAVGANNAVMVAQAWSEDPAC